MAVENPKDFEQFLVDAGIKPTLKTWLATRPGLKKELDGHILRGASSTMLYQWLVQEYSYPMERTSVVRYATVLKATV